MADGLSGLGGVGGVGKDGPTILHVYTLQVQLGSQVEQALALLSAQRETLTDHEARIRALESRASGDRTARKGITEDVEDHEKRLRWLEKWMRALPASTVLALIAALGSIISAFAAR